MAKTIRKSAKKPTLSKATRGRPRVHREPWTKVSVVLFRRQLTQLDRLSRIAARGGRKTMTRAGIIRALIDGLVGSHIDLAGHSSEAALRAYVTSRLGAGGSRRRRWLRFDK
jgi:hypothetical protein